MKTLDNATTMEEVQQIARQIGMESKTYTNAWRAVFDSKESALAACYFFGQRKVYRAFPCNGYWYFRTGMTSTDIMVTAMPTDLRAVPDEEFDALYEQHIAIMKEALTPIP